MHDAVLVKSSGEKIALIATRLLVLMIYFSQFLCVNREIINQ